MFQPEQPSDRLGIGKKGDPFGRFVRSCVGPAVDAAALFGGALCAQIVVPPVISEKEQEDLVKPLSPQLQTLLIFHRNIQDLMLSFLMELLSHIRF